jgi:hypothetical protein
MTIYLDTCALNRLTDDLTQPRVRREAEALSRVFDLISAGKERWIASTVLEDELSQNADPIRRLDNLKLLTAASLIIAPSDATLLHANTLTRLGFAAYDALHLATAQQADAEWLLTTDDRFLSMAIRKTNNRHPELINPVDYLQRRQP